MRLARKITLPIMLAGVGTLAVSAWVQAKGDFKLHEEDTQSDQAVVAQVLAKAVLREAQGPGRVPDDVVNDANENQNRVLFLWLDDAEFPSRGSLSQEHIDALHRGETLFLVDTQHWNSAATFVPLRLPDGRFGAIWVQEPLTAANDAMRRILISNITNALVLALLWLALSLAMGTVLVGRPMQRLRTRLRQIVEGDLTSKLELNEADEFIEVSTDVNRMVHELDVSRTKLLEETTERLRTQEALRHADRLNTVGKLASGIAHELGTPLNVVAARARMIATGEIAGEQAQHSARIVMQQSETMTRIIRQLLDFARRTTPTKTHESLNELVGSTTVMIAPLAEKTGCRFEVAPSEPVALECDRGQLQQLLTNLLMNAVHAMPRGGVVQVAISRQVKAPPPDMGGHAAPHACIQVHDEGTGIAPELLTRIFEPFFTTKDVGEGTGLGLSVSWGIARDHGGWISVDSKVGHGSTFSVYLPLEKSA
jgi:signal transduction histidine kinase